LVLLRELKASVVTTLHTVLQVPTAGTTDTWHAACIAKIREPIAMGAQTRGDVSIVLTAKEVEALKRAIRECTTNTGSSDVTPLKAIAAKLKTAEETDGSRIDPRPS
jgi:hypothetical protein